MVTGKRDRIRTAVVGCVVVADYGHLPAIHQCPDAELIAVADPDKDRREKQAKKYNVPCFAGFEEMLTAVELDAVTLATHPDVRLDLVRVAAAAGLHVFCEKPLTQTVSQAEELVQLMDDAGRFLAVAFVYRGMETVQRMMQLVRDGAIGRVRALHVENLWDYHGLRDNDTAPDGTSRRHRGLENMGVLDCGVHHLDLLRYMSGGEFAAISAVGAVVESRNRFPDHIMIHGRMDNGVIVSLEESAVWGYTAETPPVYQQSYRMVGENGVLAVHFGDRRRMTEGYDLHVISGERSWTEKVSTAKAWDAAYRQFFQVIQGRSVPHRFLADGRDGLVSMKLAAEVLSQCRTR